MVKVGIISFAHMHAWGYASNLLHREGANLSVIWDDDIERGMKAASQLGARFISDLDAFFAEDISAVIITAENKRHCEFTMRAAAAGKWVLCEKPLATNVEDACSMIESCEQAGVGLMTAFPCRYSPSLLNVKHQLDSGVYGTVYAGSCTNNGQYPGGWFGLKTMSGGGATMDHTVHVVDLLRWMTGKEFVRVYCENGNQVGRDTDLDDVGVVHLEMEDGAVFSHIASWNRPLAYPTWGDVTLELIGEKGVIAVDAFNQKINLYNDDDMRAAWLPWCGDMDTGLVDDFICSVEQKKTPPITGYDGLKAVEVTVAAYESVHTGRSIALKSY